MDTEEFEAKLASLPEVEPDSEDIELLELAGRNGGKT